MRHWILHPLIFYPVMIVLAALVVTISLRPQSWPKEPVAAAAHIADGALVYAGAAFDAPAPAPEQHLTVTRDFFGNPENLRIAILPEHGEPTANEQGVRILMTPEDAALIANRPVTIEVAYNALPVNATWGLAVSLQGAGPAQWVIHPTPTDAHVVSFELPAQNSVNALGLRAFNQGADTAFGLEITRIRVIPRA